MKSPAICAERLHGRSKHIPRTPKKTFWKTWLASGKAFQACGRKKTLENETCAEPKGGENIPKSKTSQGWPLWSTEGTSKGLNKRNGIGGQKMYRGRGIGTVSVGGLLGKAISTTESFALRPLFLSTKMGKCEGSRLVGGSRLVVFPCFLTPCRPKNTTSQDPYLLGAGTPTPSS